MKSEKSLLLFANARQKQFGIRLREHIKKQFSFGNKKILFCRRTFNKQTARLRGEILKLIVPLIRSIVNELTLSESAWPTNSARAPLNCDDVGYYLDPGLFKSFK